MLVNAADMFQEGRGRQHASVPFNTNNLEWTPGYSPGCRGGQVSVDPSADRWCRQADGRFAVCADMVKAAVELRVSTVPVALHLDHGSYEDCFKCTRPASRPSCMTALTRDLPA